MRRIAIALVLVLGLTACGTNGTDWEFYRDQNGQCHAELHINRSGRRDSDYKTIAPCEIEVGK